MLIKRVIESELFFLQRKGNCVVWIVGPGQPNFANLEICEAIREFAKARDMIPMSMGSYYQFEFLPGSRLQVVHDPIHGPNLAVHMSAEIDQDMPGRCRGPERNQKAVAKTRAVHANTNGYCHHSISPVNTSEAEVAIVIEGDIRSQGERIGHAAKIFPL